MRRDWSEARAKVDDEARCRNCARSDRKLEAAHIGNRSYDVRAPLGWDGLWAKATLRVHPNRIVPLCAPCHRLYDAHSLDLLGRLTNAEELQLVADMGLELARKRICSGDYSDRIEAARLRDCLEAA